MTGDLLADDAFRDKTLSSAHSMAKFRRKVESRHQDALARSLELLDGWMLLNDPPDHTRLRTEVRIALTRLFEHHPEITTTSDILEWSPTVVDRSLKALPVTIRP